MYYQNYNSGGYIGPNNRAPPQNYGQSYNYTAYGPNVYPPQENMNMNMYDMGPDYETRISTLERQIRKLDARIDRLESASNTLLEDDIINTNNYII